MLHSRTTGVIHSNFILPRTPVPPKSCACYLFVLRSLPIIFFVSRKVAECRQVWADRTGTESLRGWCLHILRSHASAFCFELLSSGPDTTWWVRDSADLQRKGRWWEKRMMFRMRLLSLGWWALWVSWEKQSSAARTYFDMERETGRKIEKQSERRRTS